MTRRISFYNRFPNSKYMTLKKLEQDFLDSLSLKLSFDTKFAVVLL